MNSRSRKKEAVRQRDAIKLTGPQTAIYLKGWSPTARFRVAVCGRRFGKTFLAVSEIRRAVRLAVEKGVSPDNEIWYGAPSFKQAKRVFWRRLKRAIPEDWRDGKPNETECSITVKSGHVIRIVGLDNYDALRGSGLWFFVGDEWADSPVDAWTEVIRPMLSTAGGHALFIGTPKGYNHFYTFYTYGDASGEPDWWSCLYTTRMGGNVPLEEIEAAKRSMPARQFRQEYDAGFEETAGRVYYAFSRAETVRDCPYDARSSLHVGMDFNVNPMSATIWQEQANGDVWQIDEIIMPTSNTDEMAEELARRYGRPSFDPTAPLKVDHITVYPDPAGAQRRTSAQGRTDISILQDRGFKLLAMSTHPLVRDRVNVVNGKFQTADNVRHAFVDRKCAKSIDSYERLTYREGTNEPDKTLGLDHISDATGYYLFGRFAYKAPQRTSIPHTGR